MDKQNSVETFTIIGKSKKYPSKYIQMLGYNFDTPQQYFEFRFADGSLIAIGQTKRWQYSQDAFIALFDAFNVVRNNDYRVVIE